ncbi:MAG: hypothetical protein KAT56_07780, partial [Sedimentisphaerales bacterium]|nr:hypothetical protein [Sedimentisphaerales bacterium]
MKSSSQITLATLLLALSLSAAGCYGGPSFNKAFNSNGIPKHQYLVGGGFEIEYVAPANGTAYWVEESTQKILETKSLNSGDKAEFGGGAMDPAQVKQLLGIDLKDVKFMLYFVPVE